MNKLLSLTLIAAFVATSLAASFTGKEADCEKRDLRCLKRRELGAIYGEIKRACIDYLGYWCKDKNKEVSELSRRLLALPDYMPPEEAEELEDEGGEEDEEEEDKREAGGCASKHLGFWCKKKRDLIQEKLNDIRSTVDKYGERKRGPAPAKPGCQSKYLGFWC